MEGVEGHEEGSQILLHFSFLFTSSGGGRRPYNVCLEKGLGQLIVYRGERGGGILKRRAPPQKDLVLRSFSGRTTNKYIFYVCLAMSVNKACLAYLRVRECPLSNYGEGRRSYHCGKMIQWLWGDPIIVGLYLIQSLEGDFVYVLWNIPLRSIKKVQMEHVMLSVMVLINGIRKKYNLFVVAIFGTSNFHSRCRRLL